MVRIAILDLYEGVANQGMRCIREILENYSTEHHVEFEVEVFDVRLQLMVPDLSFDIYISSGGPGSPLDSADSQWEARYFAWLRQVEAWNADRLKGAKKQVLFICHSFQLACRYFQVGEVCPRRSTSFGVFPVHMLDDAEQEPIFRNLRDPFFAVDSRDYQVIQPNHRRLREMGAAILCIEKERPHVACERALMGIRFNEHMVGTQFHPEADAVGMSIYLQTDEKKKTITENYGFAKWQSMIDQLNDPEKISHTHDHIIPNFLDTALDRLIPVLREEKTMIS